MWKPLKSPNKLNIIYGRPAKQRQPTAGTIQCELVCPVPVPKRRPIYNAARNIILIVSALIAAVTFQAGVSPPGGVWQDSSNGNAPGSAIYSSRKIPFYTFLIFNTLALSASIFSIISLTFMFPFSTEIWIATVSMVISYCSAILAITPHGDSENDYKFRYVLLSALVPLVVRFVVEFCKYMRHTFCRDFHPWRFLCCSPNDP